MDVLHNLPVNGYEIDYMAPGTQGETETDEIGAALEDTFRSRAVEQEGNNRRRKVRRARRASVAAGDPHVTVFKGIPYAEAPVGENRWRPPIPKGKWEGVFDAVRFGNVCPQGIPQPAPSITRSSSLPRPWRPTARTACS